LVVLLAAAVLALAGCGDDGKAEKVKTIKAADNGAVFVGKVQGTSANIGLVTKNGKLAGFVCEDENSALRLDPVPLEGGDANLVFDGRNVGVVAITDHGAAGKIEMGGLQHIFAAEVATGKAGVYRRASDNPDIAWDGWIVLNDGTYTGTSKSKPTTGRPWINPEIDP
jgi:hypothetical protein